jgi:asparagine synthase (glutamine-hydrolysing)
MEQYWGGLPVPLRAGLRRASARLSPVAPWGRRLAKSFAHADASPRKRLAGYFMWADSARLTELFAPEHRATLAGEEMSAPMEQYLAALPSGLDPLQQMLALEQRFFLADHNLLYTDKMSMAAGVEARVPFLDNDLVRLANALPARFKQKGTTGKWILKQAMRDHLPHDVIHRAKTGFGAPLRQWLRRELAELVDDTLSAAALRRRGLFHPASVSQLITDDRAGRVDAAYTVLGLVCIEIWCRTFLDVAVGPAHVFTRRPTTALSA